MSLATYTAKTWVDYADTPCLEALELNRIDAGIAAVTAEVLSLEALLPSTYQPISSELSALAGLSSTGYAKRSGAAAWSVVPSIPQADVTGLTAALAGLQPLDSDLTAIAALTTATFGRSLLTVADAAAARTAIGAQVAGSYEPALGNPGTSGWVLSSTAAGVRSWVALPAAGVSSVFGRTGAVVAASGDYSAYYLGLTAQAADSAKLGGVAAASYALASAIPAASSTVPAALGTAAVGTGTTWARADHVHAMPTAEQVGAQAALGYTPVRQGGGTGQLSNIVFIGWSSFGTLRLQIDATNFGATWPISINGSANAVPWYGVAGKPTTLSGYGITDAQAALGFTPVNKSGDSGIGNLSLIGELNGVTATFSGVVTSKSVFIADKAQTTDVAGGGARIAIIDSAAGNNVGWIIQKGSTNDRLQFFHQNSGSWTEVASIDRNGAASFASLSRSGYTVWDAGNLTGTRNEHNHAGVYATASCTIAQIPVASGSNAFVDSIISQNGTTAVVVKSSGAGMSTVAIASNADLTTHFGIQFASDGTLTIYPTLSGSVQPYCAKFQSNGAFLPNILNINGTFASSNFARYTSSAVRTIDISKTVHIWVTSQGSNNQTLPNGTYAGQLLMLKNITGAVVYLAGSISSYLITLATSFSQWIIWNGSNWE